MSLQTNSECNIYGHIHRVWPGIPGGTRYTHRHAHTEVWQSLSPFLFPLSLLSWTKSAFYLFFKIFYLEKSLIRNDPCNPPCSQQHYPQQLRHEATKRPHAIDRWMDTGDVARVHTHTHTHTHTGILLSHKKKKKKTEQGHLRQHRWTQRPSYYVKQIRKRKTNTRWRHLYVESKIRHKWTHLQNRNTLTDIEEKLIKAGFLYCIPTASPDPRPSDYLWFSPSLVSSCPTPQQHFWPVFIWQVTCKISRLPQKE